jgi:Spy/CpxP family protein refolding chaperone
MTMGSTTRAHRRRLRLAVAGAVVLTALTAATAAASQPRWEVRMHG